MYMFMYILWLIFQSNRKDIGSSAELQLSTQTPVMFLFSPLYLQHLKKLQVCDSSFIAFELSVLWLQRKSIENIWSFPQQSHTKWLTSSNFPIILFDFINYTYNKFSKCSPAWIFQTSSSSSGLKTGKPHEYF